MVDVNWFGEVNYDHVFYLRRTHADNTFTDLKGQTGGRSNPHAGLAMSGSEHQGSAVGGNDSSTPGTCTIKFFDDGGAITKWSAAGLGAITYTLYVITDNSAEVATNTTIADTDAAYTECGYTIMTATEIAG